MVLKCLHITLTVLALALALLSYVEMRMTTAQVNNLTLYMKSDEYVQSLQSRYEQMNRSELPE